MEVFCAEEDVAVSSVFFSGVFTFEGGVVINEPADERTV